LLAGTYNGHPVAVSAAIATIEYLLEKEAEVYGHLAQLGRIFETGFETIRKEAKLPLTLARQGSAFCIYFMDHAPVDWHDIAQNHDFAADLAMRQAVMERGIFPFPLATKQWSISAAHTEPMIHETLEAIGTAILQPALR
jgi:glutamate-1-semialdehyde 2,1-aminomutase